MTLAVILFVGALVVLAFLFLWSFQRERLEINSGSGESSYSTLPIVGQRDGVLIADQRGRLVYSNDMLREWVRTPTLSIEAIAGRAEPVDLFFELLTRETTATVQINGRWLQGESRRIVEKGEPRTVIVLRDAANADSRAYDPQVAIRIIDEISETVNAAQGVEPVLQALITIVRKHIPADAGEITLWDEKNALLYPRGWVGETSYVLMLAEAGGVYRLGEGISGWVAQTRQPLLVADWTAPDAVKPKLSTNPFSSFIAIPLVTGDRLLGTFELCARKPFDSARLALLQNVAQSISTAIVNAELYAEQTRRIGEIADLQSVVDQEALLDSPETVFGALAERTARLLDAQMAGTLIYDERRERLVPQPPFFGLPPVIVRSLNISVRPDTPAHAIFMTRDYWLSNDLSDEPAADDLSLTLLYNTAGVRTALLMPLIVGVKRVGMLVVLNKSGSTGFSAAGFSDRDARTLRPLAAQIAIAVESVRLAAQERIRETEMAGLQEISQVFSAIGHTDQFYASITERLARMMNVEMCGVLMHDPARAALVPQPPFYGMDGDMDYVIGVQPDSPMGIMYEQEDYWFTNSAATDRLIYSAGLAEATAVAGIYKTMLASLPAAGQRIGAVQVSNPRDGRDFTDEDARLLQIYAAQVGTMIENARLFRAVQEQVDVSESIRRIAEEAGAINTPDDSFTPILAEVAKLIGSPQSFINVIDAETGNLKTYPDYVYAIALPETLVFDTYSRGFEYSVAISRRPFFSSDLDADKRVLPEYRKFSEKLGLKTVLMVPLVVGDQSLGEIGVVNRFEPPYDEDDMRTLQAVAVHIAAALDRVRLAQSTGQNMRRRLQELDAISRVSNELAQTLDLDQTLGVIRHEAIRALEASGSIVLFTPQSEWRKPEQPQVERRIGERLPAIAAIEVAAVRDPHALIIDDYAESDLRAMPPEARSALAVSFSYEENVVGVIHLWDARPNHFDDAAGAFLETLASKASLSYGNNRRYLENQDRSNRLARRVEQLNQIFELGQVLEATTDTVSMLEAIAFSVGQSIGWDIVIMLMTDEDGVLRRVTQAGLPLDAFEQSRHLTITGEKLAALFEKTDFRISESYFFPIQKLTEWYVEGMEAFGSGIAVTRTMHPHARTDWHDGDMLIVPLHGVGGDLLGIMSLDRPYDSRRPDRAVIEILEVFAHQAASTMENARLFSASQRSAEQEARLNQVLGAVSSTFDIQEIVRGVATGTLGMVPFSRMTVALLSMTTGRTFEALRVEADPDTGDVRVARETRLDLTDTALRRAFETGQDHLYTLNDPSALGLRDLALWREAGERISLVVPLIAGGMVLGAMHLGSQSDDATLFDEQGALIRRIASLTGIAVQNARLFADTRARTDRLSLLNRVSTALAQSLDTENVMEIALQETAQLLDMRQARAYLVDRDMRVVRAVVDFPRGDAPPDAAFTFDERPLFLQTINRTSPVLIDDLASSDETVLPAHLHMDGITAYALMPMTVGGNVNGLLEMYTTEPNRSFDPEKLEMAVLIASQAAIGVLNANLLEQQLVRTRELETLVEATQAAAYTLDLDDVLRSVTRLALQALDLQNAAILLYDSLDDALIYEMEFSTIDGEIDENVTRKGSQLALKDYPAKSEALRRAQITIIRTSDPASDAIERADLTARGARERMIVPLIVRDQVIGLMEIDMHTPLKTFTHREVRMAQSLGAQAATAIENARLSTETAAQVEQSLIINDVSFAISSTMDVADMMSIIREQVVNLTDASEVSVALYDAEQRRIVFPMVVRNGGDLFIPPQPLGEDEISFVIRNRRPLSLGGVNPSAEEVRRNLGIVSSDNDTTRFLGVPLLAGDDVMGVLSLRDRGQRRPFGLNDQRVLNAIATQLAATLQNARLFERVRSFAAELNTRVEERTRELQEERDRLEALYQITSELARSLDADRIYTRSLEMSVRATGADAGFVTLIDPIDDGERAYVRAALLGGEATSVQTSGSGMTALLDSSQIDRMPAERFAAWLVQHERSTLIDDLHGAPFWDPKAPGAEPWRSAIGVVMEINEEPQGVIVLFGKRVGQFSVPLLRLVLAAANQIASAINNAELYGLIREQNERMANLLRTEQEEAQKNSAILEGIADGVLLADVSGKIILFNRAAATILDIPREYAMGRTLAQLGGQYVSAFRWVSRLTGWIADPRRVGAELNIDRLEIGARVVSVRAASVSIGQYPLGTVAVFRDVTRDVELDRMKSEFISNVSHELRTPMTSIMGYAELLLGGAAGTFNDNQRRFIDKIKGNADRLSSLVGDLLNISRIDSGRDRLTIQNVDVRDVVEQAASTSSSRPQHVDKHIALTVDIAPGLPLIRADRLKLLQIIGNIMDNAYNYTGEGGAIAVAVDTRMKDGRSQVLFSVQDSGIGIPEEFQHRIFNRFERDDDSALVMDVAGTGLGLSIVKALVEMHEGEVWFDSTMGVGTTFYVALPVEGPRAISEEVTANNPIGAGGS